MVKNFTTNVLMTVGLTLMMGAMAGAQATRTWVSGVGDDANPCSRTAPCKTFAGAISKTAAGGEISVLDPGGFGPVTITKSITLDGEGIVASILASGTPGINVAAGPNDAVKIRHIEFQGLAGGTNTVGTIGILYTSGARVVVDDCNIIGFGTDGIATALSGAGVTGNLVVNNTTIDGGADCVFVNATSGATVNASLRNDSIHGCTNGLEASAGLTDISSSVVAMNSSFGLLANGTGVINSESNMLTVDGTGVQANTGATVRLANTDIFDNTFVIGNGGGTVATANNNHKASNSGGSPGSTNATIASF